MFGTILDRFGRARELTFRDHLKLLRSARNARALARLFEFENSKD